MNPDELGEAAYNAYCAALERTATPWIQLSTEQRFAWSRAAGAVWTRVMGSALAVESRLVPVTKPTECPHCGFIWPPSQFHHRCPGCQQVYDG